MPIDNQFVNANLLPALSLKDAEAEQAEYTLEGLIRDLVGDHPAMSRACVSKRQFRFTVQDCATEIVELLINGAAIRSIAVESEDAAAVLSVIETVGLSEYENVAYPLAIKRFMGLEPLPDEGRYGQ